MFKFAIGAVIAFTAVTALAATPDPMKDVTIKLPSLCMKISDADELMLGTDYNILFRGKLAMKGPNDVAVWISKDHKSMVTFNFNVKEDIACIVTHVDNIKYDEDGVRGLGLFAGFGYADKTDDTDS